MNASQKIHPSKWLNKIADALGVRQDNLLDLSTNDNTNSGIYGDDMIDRNLSK